MKTKLPNPKKAKRFFARKMAFTLGPVELNRRVAAKEPITVVDVRAAQDYAAGRIPGALSLPKDKWSKPALKKDRINVVYCYSQVCHLAAAAALELAGQGFPVMELEGGFDAWKAFKFPIEKKAVAKKPARKHSRAKQPAPQAEPLEAAVQAAPEPETAPAA